MRNSVVRYKRAFDQFSADQDCNREQSEGKSKFDHFKNKILSRYFIKAKVKNSEKIRKRKEKTYFMHGEHYRKEQNNPPMDPITKVTTMQRYII